jgi:hypothetical protein
MSKEPILYCTPENRGWATFGDVLKQFRGVPDVRSKLWRQHLSRGSD